MIHKPVSASTEDLLEDYKSFQGFEDAYTDHYNSTPLKGRQFEEIQVSDLFGKYLVSMVYSPHFTEFRQIRPDHFVFQGTPVRCYMNVHIDYYHDGLLIAKYKDSQSKSIRYFAMKYCDHVMTCQNLGRCWNRYTCQKCGFIEEVDSSD